MKKEWVLIFILTLILAGLLTAVVISGFENKKPESVNLTDQAVNHAAKEKKILYYRNPMDPTITSPVAMKDSMGMDYVAVYADQANSQETGVYIAPDKQQMVGIETQEVINRDLTHIVATVGKIAYDPDLYVAQEEYIQALKMSAATQNSELASVTEQSGGLLKAAGKKLQLLGMSQEEIKALSQKGLAQENLYLPISQEPVWVYLIIHEQEIGLIKEGMLVEIEAIAYPGEIFKGKIVAISPVLDASTRSAQVRVEVDNADNKLKPQMYVNAKINVELGQHLAVPKSAVMDTGERQVVFIAKPDGYFESRDIKAGDDAGQYYEVVSGLNEGDRVVSSGNFFVDSESKLKSSASD